MVWFVFNENMKVVEKNKVDSFDCDIAQGHIFISGWYFEQSGMGKLKIQTNENRCFFSQRKRYTHLLMWKFKKIFA